MRKSKTTVALYVCLDMDGIPRYVGETIDPFSRGKEHQKLKPWFCCLIILEWASLSTYKKKEKMWIAYFRQLGFPLENKNNGGQGAIKGSYKQTAESNQKRSIAHTGKKQGPPSLEHIAKISAALKGVPKTPEHNAKVGLANTGKTWSSEQKKRKSEQMKGKTPWNKGKTVPHPTDCKCLKHKQNRIDAGLLPRTQPESAKRSISEAGKLRFADPSERKKQSVRLKQSWERRKDSATL